MNPLRVARARLLGLFRKAQLDDELDEEMRFHVAMRAQENVARGLPEPEAWRQAARAFGNVARLKDECRDVSGGGALEILWRDVRFAARMLLKDRAFTAIAVLALALGIGANTALFTVMSSVVLRPLPFPQPDRILSVRSHKPDDRAHPIVWSYPDFVDLRSRNHSFEQLGAFRPASFVVSNNGGESTAIEAALVTPEVFAALGVKPELGRTFTRADNEPGARSVIISHRMWEERFGRAAGVTDTNVTLDGEEYRIIGVMPPDFRFPIQNRPAQLWTTLARELQPPTNGGVSVATRRDAHFLAIIGRLRDGVTAEAAGAEMREITAALGEQFPDTNRPFDSCSVSPWLADLTRNVRPALMMLNGAALCVLGIACANVANLLLARGSTRQKEIAVRSALGAGRGRILRQLLTETLLLAALGGAGGLLIALIGTPAIVALLPANFPRAGEITPDVKVLAFTVGITIATSCFFGFAPAWRSARCEPARVLNDCSRAASETPHGRRTRNALVVAEMVLAFVLLSGAVFLIRNLWRLEHASPGFNPRGLLALEVAVPPTNAFDTSKYAVAIYQDLMSRLPNATGIEAVSAVAPLPVSGTFPTVDYAIRGRAIAKPELPLAEPHIILPNYFRTMEIAFKAGRDFDARDSRGAAPVVIINEALARASFPHENPIGKCITPGMADDGRIDEREIVGVVADVKCDSLSREAKPELFVPHTQCATAELALLVRGDLSEEALLRTVRDVAANMDIAIAIEPPRSMESYIAAAVAQPRLNSTLFAAFALVAVVITAIGVYGVMAYSVAQRRHEIGIRLALGAQKLAVFRLVISDALRLVGWSVVIGGLGSFAATPVLRRFAYGAGADEGPTILLVAFLLAGTALVACWLPAQQAANEDPLVAIGQR
jgi:predicted permease